jgi:glutamine synthetase
MLSVQATFELFIPLTIEISGWDVHDAVYSPELLISTRANGYRDLLASIDLSTYRRIPWEDNVPFFLVSMFNPETKEPIPVCPRGVLKRVASKVQSQGWEPMAGCEFEVSSVSCEHDWKKRK